MRRALVLAGAVALAWPATARACASCGCGDPTLTVLGNEKPLADRLRVGTDLVAQSASSGEPGRDEIALAEQRLELQAAWAPHPRLYLLLTVPLLRRSVSYVNLGRKEVRGVADPELRARWIAWSDRAFSPRHLLSLIGGARLGLAPTVHDAAGAPAGAELQPGSGSFGPIAGVAYGHFHYPWSEYASAQAFAPVAWRDGLRPGASLRTTGAIQRQLTGWLAARAAVDTRLEGAALEGGQRDPDTGGFVVFASPELLVSPFVDLVLFAGVHAPVARAMVGHQTVGAVWSGGVVYDF